MTYYLGIDLGTTYVGAARLRDGRAEIITLGDRAAVVPSVLYFKDDGEVLTGGTAIRRGLTDPARVVREFKRRVGDSTPVMVGSSPYSPESLMAELLRWVVETVTAREGSAPAGVAVTHPANWGPYKTDVLAQAVRMAEVGPVTTLTEPEAAAIHYAFTERLEPGDVVAVYDLGGGTFDAAVLAKTAGGFELLGDAEGIDRLGGIDFDEAVFQHTLRWVGSSIQELDADDPNTLQAVARLREECVAAKEELSRDTDVSIPVLLPNVQTEVRLTRAEFEAMIRPAIGRTIDALRRALDGAGVTPEQISAVLLVGGSSRIPLIAQMVGAELGRPIAVDVHPKHAVALGAAIAAASGAQVAVPAPVAPEPDAEVAEPVPSADVAAAPLVTAPGSAVPAADRVPVPAGRQRPRWLMAAAGVAAGAVVLLGGFTLSRAGAGTGVVASTTTTEAAVAGGSTSTAPPGATTVPVGTVPPATTSTTSTSTTTTSTTTTVPVEEGLVVTIDAIEIADGAYSVAYSTNFDPLISTDPESHHIHFFFDTVAVGDAGVPGPGPWILYDSPAPFTGYSVADRPAGATQMCATAATSEHAVADPARFSCMELPDAG